MNDRNAWNTFWLGLGGAAAVVVGIGLVSTFEWPDTESVQVGHRGNGMAQIYNQVSLSNLYAETDFPEPQPDLGLAGVPSSEVYDNVQVLGHVDATEFIRLMSAITEWVSPEEGCAYCHAEGEELSSDSLYTKRVSRRMIEMTMTINQDWEQHVGVLADGGVGVTCYTCHRGQAVPAEIWFEEPGQWRGTGLVGNPGGQNLPAQQAGLSSLPYDPFTPYLNEDPAAIRVGGDTALPTGNRTSIKQTEWTYSLMMHMSTSLGVNCTFCHNSRAFSDWEQSPVQRTTAWHGLRMVEALNQTYLDPLQPEYPDIRLGDLGDAPKANCATCHQGAYKPLFGYPMLEAYPTLAAAGPPELQDPPMGETPVLMEMPVLGEDAPETSQ